MQPRMCYDDAAWEKSEENTDAWVRQLFDPEIATPIGEFLVRHHEPDAPVAFDILEKGSFNIALRMTYKNGAVGVIRFPLPGATMFPEEKLRYEVATMRYIHDQTSIPVPFVFHWGPKESCALELAPFLIMEYIEHGSCMYDLLNIPGCPHDERGRLNPNINEDHLEALYSELASDLLQLSKPSFPGIGSLTQVDDFIWDVVSRPLSVNTNELIRPGSLPQSSLPSHETTFNLTSSYSETLAELHIAHLRNQRNDAIESADDCRRKFIARHLFRKLTHERKLTKRWQAFDKGPFKIWGDDSRPANFLVNSDSKIVGIVDWKFTYTAPIEFTYAPPWWLLLEKPEYWPEGLKDWTQVFARRLHTFLDAMIKCEDVAIKEGQLTEDERLSGPMKESWESGDFWIAYAARKNFAFDSVYWNKIDQRFFGPADNVEEAWRQRLGLLSDEERDEMERLVAQKLKEMENRVLASDPDEYTRSHTDIAKRYPAKGNKIEAEEGDGDNQKPGDDEVEAHGIEARPEDPDAQQMSEKLGQLST